MPQTLMNRPDQAATASPGRGWFARLAWGTLVYNLAVALWGAYVRASGSGAGCGAHWPLCEGVVLPSQPKTATLIELAHRASSGIDVILVLIMFVLAFRLYPRGRGVRGAALLSAIFLFDEALIGAALVLFHQVGQNASWTRAVYLSIHLINTFLLIGFLAMTAWWASRSAAGHPLARFRNNPRARRALGIVLTIIAIGITGVIAALGDTLFPSQSLPGAFRLDFSHAAPALLRARVFHPFVAASLAIVLAIWAIRSLRRAADHLQRQLSLAVLSLLATELVLGVINILLLAPVWMQIVHLCGAYLLWTAMVLLILEQLATPPAINQS